MVDCGDIQAIAGVAIGVNGVVGWLEKISLPLVTRNNKFAFAVFCQFYLDKTRGDNSNLNCAGQDAQGSAEYSERLKKLKSLEQYQVNVGVSIIAIHFLRFLSLLCMFAGMFLLVYAKECSDVLKKEYCLLLFLPQLLTFLFLMWLYLGKLFPWRPIYELGQISLDFVWEYEKRLVKKYFESNSRIFKIQDSLKQSMGEFTTAKPKESQAVPKG